MKRFFTFLIIGSLMSSCNDSDHFGYNRLENSIHYRLISIGDEDKPVKTAEHLSMTIHLYDQDTIHARKVFKRINWDESEFPAYIKKLLLGSYHGDSIAIVGNASEMDVNALFGKEIVESSDNDIHMMVFISEAFNDEQLRSVLANERLKLDGELNEKATLLKVLDSLGIDEEDFVDGIYVKTLKTTNGREPKKGDLITVNYSARLGNGRLVDDNFKLESFTYEVGKPDQVIPGFSIGISQMNEGSEALFVLPSSYGFGTEGSSSKIIPGYSVLVYRVKLIEVAD